MTYFPNDAFNILQDPIDVTSNFPSHLQNSFIDIDFHSIAGIPKGSRAVLIGHLVDIDSNTSRFVQGQEKGGSLVSPDDDIVLNLDRGGRTDVQGADVRIAEWWLPVNNASVSVARDREGTGTIDRENFSLLGYSLKGVNYPNESVEIFNPHIDVSTLLPGDSQTTYVNSDFSSFLPAGDTARALIIKAEGETSSGTKELYARHPSSSVDDDRIIRLRITTSADLFPVHNVFTVATNSQEEIAFRWNNTNAITNKKMSIVGRLT